MDTDDHLLWRYKELGQSSDLVNKHLSLIEQIASLCKGNTLPNTGMSRWFYGLFLGTMTRNTSNLMSTRDLIQEATASLEYDECYQEIVCLFLEQASNFRVKPIGRRRLSRLPRTYFHHFIRTSLGWQAKNWLDKVITRYRIPIRDTEVSPEEQEPAMFSLSLPWVLNGDDHVLFRELRPYDRYILYLYFAAGYDLRKIAHTTYQSKNTVNADLQKILDQCKRNAKSLPHQTLPLSLQSL